MADLVTSVGLVIGYGSVGRRHAAAMAEHFPDLVVVDSSAAALERAVAAHPRCRVADSLGALGAGELPWAETVAVIATWGPSHAGIFHELADRGVKHILCEKPLAASVADARAMAARAERDGITLGVHHYLRHTGIAPALRHYARENGLGEPVTLIGTGGAACLVTNGIHWIDFATELFEAGPSGVTSTAYGEQINPRAPDLLLAGGTAVWSFGEGREAVLSFSNRSSVALDIRVYFRNAVAEVDGDAAIIRVRHRDRDALARFPAVTRCGPASETLHDGVLPGTRPAAAATALAIREVAAGGPTRATGEIGATAVSSVIGALVSGRSRARVSLPLSPDDSLCSEQWSIS